MHNTEDNKHFTLIWTKKLRRDICFGIFFLFMGFLLNYALRLTEEIEKFQEAQRIQNVARAMDILNTVKPETIIQQQHLSPDIIFAQKEIRLPNRIFQKYALTVYTFYQDNKPLYAVHSADIDRNGVPQSKWTITDRQNFLTTTTSLARLDKNPKLYPLAHANGLLPPDQQ